MPISACHPFVLANPRALLAPQAAGDAAARACAESGPTPCGRTYYRPDQYHSLKAFRQSDAFMAFRGECEEDIDHIVAFVSSVAMHPQMDPSIAEDLVQNFEGLKAGLFAATPPPAFDFSSHRGQLYTDGKPGLERIRAGLYDERIPLEARIAKLRNCAQALGSCSGGIMNGIARAALQLELARESGLPGAFRAAFHAVLESVLLEGVPSAMGLNQSTHAVQAALNALAPTLGFDPVRDPYVTPLHPEYKALIDRLQTPEGMGRLADMALDALADECSARFVQSLPADHPLRHHGSIDCEGVARQIMPLLRRDIDQRDIDRAADAIAAHGSLQQTELVRTYGPLDTNDLLRENDDGTYALNRDTSLLQRALANNLKANGIFAEFSPRAVASWETPLGQGRTATATLHALGKARWISARDCPDRPVELADLDHLQGGEVSDDDFLAAASRVMEGMSHHELMTARFRGLEPRLRSLTPKQADRLPGLMACLRARPEYQRVVIDDPNMAIGSRVAWAIELDLPPPPTKGLRGGAPADAEALLRRAVLKGNAPAVLALLDIGAQPGDAARELRFEIGLDAMTARQRKAVNALAARADTTRHLFDSILRHNIANMQTAVDAGADIDQPGPQGVRPLHYAIVTRSQACAKWLIERGADVNAADPASGKAPLEMALEAGNGEIAEALLVRGARAMLEGKPPTHLLEILGKADSHTQATLAGKLYAGAGARGDRQVVLDAIILRPTRPFYWVPEAFTRAIVAEAVRNDDLTPDMLREHAGLQRLFDGALSLPDPDAALRTVTTMLDHGRSIEGKRGWNALRLAAANGNTRLVGLLLERGATIPVMEDTERLMEAAAAGGHEDTVLYLLERAHPHQREPLLSAALRVAAINHQLPLAASLGEMAPAFVVLDVLGWHGAALSPRVAACMKDQVWARRATLAGDQRLPRVLWDALGSGSGSPELVADLIAESGCGQQCGGGLLVRAIRRGHGAVAQSLLRAKVPFTVDDIAALAEAKHPDWARQLASELAHVGNAKPESLDTLLRVAPDVIATLVDKGLDPRARTCLGRNLLETLARTGPVDVLNRCLAHASAPCSDAATARTLIGIAAREGKDEIAAALLDAALPDSLPSAEKAARASALFTVPGPREKTTSIVGSALQSLDRGPARARIVSRMLDYAPARAAIARSLSRVLYLAASLEQEHRAAGEALIRKLANLQLPIHGRRHGRAFTHARDRDDWQAVTALLREGICPRHDREYGDLLADAIKNSGPSSGDASAATAASVALVERLHENWQRRNPIVRFFVSLFYGKAAWIDFPLPGVDKTPAVYARAMGNRAVIDKIAGLTGIPGFPGSTAAASPQ